jgi:hypothetical protein
MSWVLIVQPEPGQAEMLRDALRAQIADEVVVASTLDDALLLIDQRLPDLILLPLLTPVAMEDHLIAYVRTIPGASHVQVLGVPLFDTPEASAPAQPRRVSLVPWRRMQLPRAIARPRCDAATFSRDAADYLATAKMLKQHSAYGEAGAAERRTVRRFAKDEVPWISVVTFGGQQADLINVSAVGALVRAGTRPPAHLLKRAVPDQRYRSRLTIEVESAGEVHATGRVVRCVPLISGSDAQYEIAFAFDDAVGLHLPTAALVPTSVADEDEQWPTVYRAGRSSSPGALPRGAGLTSAL